MPDPNDEGFVFLGVITGAIGVRGEVRVKTFTETPFGLVDYGPLLTRPGGQQLEVLSVREVKTGLAVVFEGISDRDAAEALKGVELGVDRQALGETEDEETFFHVDLVGLEVRDETGEAIGQVHAVHDFGGGDVLELTLTGQEKTEMVPFNIDVVPNVNPEGGFLEVREIAWLETGKDKEGESE